MLGTSLVMPIAQKTDEACRWLLVADHNSAQDTKKLIHMKQPRCTVFTVNNATAAVDVLTRSHFDYVHVDIGGGEYLLLDSIIGNGGLNLFRISFMKCRTPLSILPNGGDLRRARHSTTHPNERRRPHDVLGFLS